MTSFKDKFKELAVKVFVPNEGEECEMVYLEDALDVANLMDVSKEGVNAEWASFRREAAKDILAGFAAKIGHPISDYPEQSCKYAIQLADELIKQLKETE